MCRLKQLKIKSKTNIQRYFLKKEQAHMVWTYHLL